MDMDYFDSSTRKVRKDNTWILGKLYQQIKFNKMISPLKVMNEDWIGEEIWYYFNIIFFIQCINFILFNYTKNYISLPYLCMYLSKLNKYFTPH